MAFNGIAGAANIGSFVLQAVSFGQCTMNKHNKIQTRLVEATQRLKDAIGELREYSKYLDDQEFNDSMKKCQSTMNAVLRDLKTDAACKSFLVAAKTYQASKISAQHNLIASIEVNAEITTISTKAKRDVETGKRTINQVEYDRRLTCINEIEMGFTYGSPNGGDSTHNPGLVAASRLDDNVTSPFRDPFRDPSVSELDSTMEGKAGDIPLELEHVTPN